VGYTGLLDMGLSPFTPSAPISPLLASPPGFSRSSRLVPGRLHTSYLLIIPLAALVAAVCGCLRDLLKLRGTTWR
jgi:branched-chain amino acid transport system permease protein